MVTIPRNVLVSALNALTPSIPYRPKTPVLAGIGLSASGGLLRLRMAVSTRHATLDLPATGDMPETWVNARALLDVARCVTGDLTLTADTKRLALEAGDARFELVVSDALPAMPAPIESGALRVGASDLRDLFDRVGCYIAPEDNRYGLSGMSWEFADGRLLGIGTDGNRLGRASVPASGVLALPERAIVNRPTIDLLRRLPLDGEVVFTFAPIMGTRPAKVKGDPDETYMRDAVIRVESAGVVVHDRLLLAAFPDWRQVVPTTYKRTVTADRDALITGFRRGGKFGTDTHAMVRVAVAAGAFTLSSRCLTKGTARAVVPCGLTGEPITIGFNHRLMLDALRTLPKGPVVVEIGDVLGPVQVRSLVDATTIGIVMPVRLDD